MDSIKWKIKGEITIIHTQVGKCIYLLDNKGNELAEVNLVDGVDLDSFLKEVQDEHSK